jgi:hypothetical protein
MSAFQPTANGQWTIYTVQKTLPYLGRFGTIAGSHDYLALVDPHGNVQLELPNGD